MTCYRYVTPSVCGKWKRTEPEALSDALRAGVAYLHKDKITPFEFTKIETMPDHRCPNC